VTLRARLFALVGLVVAVSVTLVVVTLIVSTVVERWVGFDSLMGGIRR